MCGSSSSHRSSALFPFGEVVLMYNFYGRNGNASSSITWWVSIVYHFGSRASLCWLRALFELGIPCEFTLILNYCNGQWEREKHAETSVESMLYRLVLA